MRVPLRLERQNAILPATTMPRAFHHREIAPSFERAADRATRAFANFPQKEETTGVKSVEEKAGERERERERACVGKGTRIGGRGGLGGRGRAGTRTVVERAGGEA